MLFTPLALPNGTILKNRIVKSAMEENLGEAGQLPGARLERVYARWSKGGTAALLTGNVMVEATAMTGPGDVVLDIDQPLDPFTRWAQACKSGGAQAWMQISHPGRQVKASMGQPTVAPSAIPLKLGSLSSFFPSPHALTEKEIETIIEKFATTAKLAEQAGFDGVQVHAAHGYLVSQFLSPLSNQRNDRYGGSLENRSRLLIEVIKAIRANVSATFTVAIKINSADFQKGGFDKNDAIKVVQMLNRLPLDLVELSGGSYESAAMQGTPKDSTVVREAYFIEFARDIAAVAEMPIMVTGGITKFSVAEAALHPEQSKNEQGFERAPVDIVGIARALAFAPELPLLWQEGKQLNVNVPEAQWKDKTFVGMANLAVVSEQIGRMGEGKEPEQTPSLVWCLVSEQTKLMLLTGRYKKWITSRQKH